MKTDAGILNKSFVNGIFFVASASSKVLPAKPPLGVKVEDQLEPEPKLRYKPP